MYPFFPFAIVCTLIPLVASAPHAARKAETRYAEGEGSSVGLKVVRNVHADHQQFTHSMYIRTAESSNFTNSITSHGRLTAFSAPITIGAQEFHLILDTGSADTWVADSYFVCNGGYSQSTCSLEDTFVRKRDDSAVIPYTDRHFSVYYADGSSASGPMANALVTLAPELTIVQQVGLANNVYGQYENLTSGVLGLSYTGATHSYTGTDTYNDVICLPDNSGMGYNNNYDLVQCNQFTYPSAIQTLISTNTSDNGTQASLLTNNYFSMALSRDSSNTTQGGIITFGGTPDYSSRSINISSNFATVPIETHTYDKTGLSRFYLISVDSISIPAGINSSALPTSTVSSHSSSSTDGSDVNKHMPNRRSTMMTMQPLGTSNGLNQYIIDSGTTFTFLPASISKSWNSLWATQNPLTGYWTVDCTKVSDDLSTIPQFTVQIGGHIFEHNPQDLVVRTTYSTYDPDVEDYVEKEYCFSAIQDAPEISAYVAGVEGYTYNILGQPFLKNVLAVFDIGNAEMGFASRTEYES